MLDWRGQGRKMRWYSLSLVLGRNRLKAWCECHCWMYQLLSSRWYVSRVLPLYLDFKFWYPFSVLPPDAWKLSKSSAQHASSTRHRCSLFWWGHYAVGVRNGRDAPKRRSVRQSKGLLASGLNFKCGAEKAPGTACYPKIELSKACGCRSCAVKCSSAYLADVCNVYRNNYGIYYNTLLNPRRFRQRAKIQ